ncbi:MAG: phage major capsid protein [Longimicrobiales bacterium]
MRLLHTTLRFGAVLVAVLLGLPAVLVGDTNDLTNMDAALKIIFDDALVNNVVTDTEVLDEFQDGEVMEDPTTGGRYIETAQMFALPTGFRAVAEGDYIPVPKGPTVENSRISLKKAAGTVEETADVLRRVRSNEGAFVDWAERTLPNLVATAKNQVDRMALGYGQGILARVDAVTPATDLVVDSAYGVTGLEDALLQFQANTQLRASPNADGSTPHSTAYTVEDVDIAGGHLVVDVVTDLADNDYLFLGDSAGVSAELDPMGLLGMVDDGGILATFQNIARSSYSAWRGHVIDASSVFTSPSKMTEQLLIYADTVVDVRGGGKPDLLVTSRQALNQYFASMQGDRTINDPRGDYTGGKGDLYIRLGDRILKVKTARKMPRTMAFLLQRDTFKKFVLNKWEWDDTTGSIWKQVVDNNGRKDAFYAYGTMQFEMACSDPQKSCRIENITDEAF